MILFVDPLQWLLFVSCGRTRAGCIGTRVDTDGGRVHYVLVTEIEPVRT
jgi:hypothetical protein